MVEYPGLETAVQKKWLEKYAQMEYYKKNAIKDTEYEKKTTIHSRLLTFPYNLSFP